jgi:hypothetical protein
MTPSLTGSPADFMFVTDNQRGKSGSKQKPGAKPGFGKKFIGQSR